MRRSARTWLALGTAAIAAVFVVAVPHRLDGATIGKAIDLVPGTFTFGSSLVSRARMGLTAADQGVVHITRELAAPAGAADRLPVTVDIWYRDPAGPADAPRLLLYTPGSGKTRIDNARTAAALARRGYVVVAVDDVEQAPELKASGIEPLSFDFSSAAAYERTLRDGDVKMARQAARLTAVLDRLTAEQKGREPPRWLTGVPLDDVGGFGWSLGGSTAAEASVTDRRIKAVVNLDGWLFGRAARGDVTVPYLLVMSQYPFPSDADLDAPEPAKRYEARLTRRDLLEERRLTSRPGSLTLVLANSVHENLSDFALDPGFWRTWFRLDPVLAKTRVDACLASFFDHYLRGAPESGCLLAGVSTPGFQRLNPITWPGAGTATAPM